MSIDKTGLTIVKVALSIDKTGATIVKTAMSGSMMSLLIDVTGMSHAVVARSPDLAEKLPSRVTLWTIHSSM